MIQTLEIMKQESNRLETEDQPFKLALPPAKIISDKIKEKLILLDKLLLILEEKLEVLETPLTTSKETAMLSKLISKELEVI